MLAAATGFPSPSRRDQNRATKSRAETVLKNDIQAAQARIAPYIRNMPVMEIAVRENQRLQALAEHPCFDVSRFKSVIGCKANVSGWSGQSRAEQQ